MFMQSRPRPRFKRSIVHYKGCYHALTGKQVLQASLGHSVSEPDRISEEGKLIGGSSTSHLQVRSVHIVVELIPTADVDA